MAIEELQEAVGELELDVIGERLVLGLDDERVVVLKEAAVLLMTHVVGQLGVGLERRGRVGHAHLQHQQVHGRHHQLLSFHIHKSHMYEIYIDRCFV